MFLRLERQSPYISEKDQPPLPDFRKLAEAYTSREQLRLGRLSPLGSESLGAPVTRIVAGCSAFDSNRTGPYDRVHGRDIITLREAIQAAVRQGKDMGGDEALYGRVGLLWAILNLRQCNVEDERVQVELEQISGSVQSLVDLIMETGKLGAQNYARDHEREGALPLMWMWHDRYYLGA